MSTAGHYTIQLMAKDPMNTFLTNAIMRGVGYEFPYKPQYCDICFLAFNDNSRRKCTTPCNHSLCRQCLESWITSENENSNRCSHCRETLFRREQPSRSRALPNPSRASDTRSSSLYTAQNEDLGHNALQYHGPLHNDSSREAEFTSSILQLQRALDDSILAFSEGVRRFHEITRRTQPFLSRYPPPQPPSPPPYGSWARRASRTQTSTEYTRETTTRQY